LKLEGGAVKQHFALMANYNSWANTRLYRMAGQLSDEQCQCDVGAYFKSLHGTLNHLLVTDRIWMSRLTEAGAAPNRLDAQLEEPLRHLHRLDADRSARSQAHLFNHQTHHRGQAHAILTGLGMKEPESLDVLWILREQSPARST
jgi:uncharacterized damage-inducible protein DinB